jgi:acyl-CoA synthetase (AMP-forming)/AMP-acid ligase II
MGMIECAHGSALITDRLRWHAAATPHRPAYTFLRDDGTMDEITYGQLSSALRQVPAQCCCTPPVSNSSRSISPA